jgi:predicted dehydrogenase
MTFKLGVIGCGLKASGYAGSWIKSGIDLSFEAIMDNTQSSVDRFAGIVRAGGGNPRLYDDAEKMLAAEAGGLDAVYISTPHALHFPYALMALEHGLDVLLEKPMSLSSDEAKALIAARDKAGKTIVVAYQASLSPLLASLRARDAAGEFGALLTVTGEVWENWQVRYAGNWKQIPALSGGGFMFDTGAHLLNAPVKVTGRSYERAAAQLQNRGQDYELIGSVMGLMSGGVPFTMVFCGDTTQGCASSVTYYYEKAMVKADIWGKWIEVHQNGNVTRQEVGEDMPYVLKAFIDTCQGRMANPSTAETSLHLAEFWECINRSSAEGAVPLALATRA